MLKGQSALQASGEAKYTGSYGYGNSLHAYPVLSTRALATVESLDASAALAVSSLYLMSHDHLQESWCLAAYLEPN